LSGWPLTQPKLEVELVDRHAEIIDSDARSGGVGFGGCARAISGGRELK
jgi:hypothetical protein